MCTRPLKEPVKIKGYPRQITEVFQEGKQGKKDGHGGEHHAYHPGGRQIHAVDERTTQPPRHTNGNGALLQPAVNGPHQQLTQQGGWHIGTSNGQPKDSHQHQRHHGEAPHAAGHNLVNGAIKAKGLRLPAPHHCPISNGRRCGIDTFANLVVCRITQLLTQLCSLCQ